MLKVDSRESLSRIAERLRISKATVSRRISKMEEEGIISGYTVITNISKMGGMRALLMLEVSGSSLDSIIEELTRFEEIEYVHKLFGDHSLLCEVYVRAVDDLYELIQDKIVKISRISNVEVDILIERIAINREAEFNMVSSSAPLSR